MSFYDDASLIVYPSGYKEDKIYSLKPTNGTGDLTFSRASSATRVNAEGLIETASVFGSDLADSWDFTSGWNTFGGGTSITNSTTFVSGSGQGIYIGLGLLVGKKYKVSIAGIQPSGGYLTIRAGTSGTSFGNISEQSFDLELSATLSSVTGTGNSFYIRLDHSASTSITITKLIIEEVITSNVPRIDYSNGCGSLLLEGQSTNLVTYSEDFSQWSQARLTNTDNQTISPDGSLNASLITEDATLDNKYTFLNLSTTTNEHALSFFAKYKGRYLQVAFGLNDVSGNPYINFDLQNGTFDNGGVSNPLIEDFGNGWYKISLQVTPIVTSNFGVLFSPIPSLTSLRLASYQGNGTSGIYLWGAQLEQSSYPTSYIISNSGTTTTRIADAASKTGISSLIGQTEGVLYAEMAPLFLDSTSRDIELSDGGTNRVILQFNSTGIGGVLLVNGATQVNFSYALSDIEFKKIAFKYKANDFALWINGVEVATDSSGSTFSSGTLTRLDFNKFNPSSLEFIGKCQNLMVFPSALTDDELADLTGAVHQTFNTLATFYNYTIL
jgi:hypothetical protein